MDGGLLNNGKILDNETGFVYWTHGGAVEFWHAFFWWDNSVDHRGMSNSGFYVDGFKPGEQHQAFKFACDAFPSVVSRQRHQLVLQSK